MWDCWVFVWFWVVLVGVCVFWWVCLCCCKGLVVYVVWCVYWCWDCWLVCLVVVCFCLIVCCIVICCVLWFGCCVLVVLWVYLCDWGWGGFVIGLWDVVCWVLVVGFWDWFLGWCGCRFLCWFGFVCVLCVVCVDVYVLCGLYSRGVLCFDGLIGVCWFVWFVVWCLCVGWVFGLIIGWLVWRCVGVDWCFCLLVVIWDIWVVVVLLFCSCMNGSGWVVCGVVFWFCVFLMVVCWWYFWEVIRLILVWFYDGKWCVICVLWVELEFWNWVEWMVDVLFGLGFWLGCE